MDEDGGGQIAEPSEEEYDALNDETFGSAINGDWEEVHENLVRLTGDGDTLDGGKNAARGVHSNASRTKNKSLRLSDSDLELNLYAMKLDDVDLNYADNENAIGILNDIVKMDASVWSLENTKDSSGAVNQLPSNPEEFLRQHFATPFQTQQNNQDKNNAHPLKHQNSILALGLHQQLQLSTPQHQPKISTLEDIERNMIMQQSTHKQPQPYLHQQQVQQQQLEAELVAKQQKILHDILRSTSQTPPHLQPAQQTIQHGSSQQQHQHMLSQQYSILMAQKGKLIQ